MSASNEGWICPACRRGVAPTEKTCDHGGALGMVGMPLIGPAFYASPVMAPNPPPWESTPWQPAMPIMCGTSMGRSDLTVVS